MLKNTMVLFCSSIRSNSADGRVLQIKLMMRLKCLTTETVKGTALSLEGIDNIKSGDSLTSGMLGVGHGISDDVLKEHLEDTTGLLVDKT